MTRSGLLYSLVGLALVGALIAGVLYYTRGNHLELNGRILQVRTLALDEKTTMMVVDFAVENPSDVQFAVRSLTPEVTAADGTKAEAIHVADSEAQRIMEYYQKQIGQREHASMLIRDKIAPHQKVERMVAARFDVPESVIKARRSLSLRLEDVDGTVATIR